MPIPSVFSVDSDDISSFICDITMSSVPFALQGIEVTSLHIPFSTFAAQMLVPPKSIAILIFYFSNCKFMFQRRKDSDLPQHNTYFK